MKVYISTTTFGKLSRKPLDLLKKKKISFFLNPLKRRMTENEIGQVLKKDSYDGLIAGTEPLTKKVLVNSKPLRVISRVGTGIGNIDLVTAKKLKIRVFNTPDIVTDSVAELTVALLLNCLRNITSSSNNIKKGIWRKEMGSLLKGKTLGIIGFGKIGKRVADLVKPFGANILFNDVKRFRIKGKAERVTLERLLRSSDIVSIHTSNSSMLLSRNRISNLKRGCIIINTSRGTAVEEKSLYKALRSKKITCAALDVYNDEPYSGDLTKIENTILTPHIGSYTKETRVKMEIEAVKNLIKGLD